MPDLSPILTVLLVMAVFVLSIVLTFLWVDRPTRMPEETDPMYDHGYQHGCDGDPIQDEFSSDCEYLAGYGIGTLDRAEALDPEFVRKTAGAYKPGPEVEDVNQVAQDFVDGYQHGEAGHDFQISLLESEAYRAGFRDGERMNGVTSC